MGQRNHIDSTSFGGAMRRRIIDTAGKSVMLAQLAESKQSLDRFHKTINCNGFGRIREYEKYSIVFANAVGVDPWKPVLRGHHPTAKLRTQVFQVAACNWRCWYCFVDDDRLSGNPKVGRFFTADEMVDMFLANGDPDIDVIDISGGEPSLVPELILWLMEALDRRGLRERFWIWCDENFSNTFLWDYLSEDQIAFMTNYPKHSRIGCFKGIDGESFSRTTGARVEDFGAQFDVCKALIRAGFDVFAYATFTGPAPQRLGQAMIEFVNRLQEIDPVFPLRTIPLKVSLFAAASERLRVSDREPELDDQRKVYDAWRAELARRFSASQLQQQFDQIKVGT